MTDWCDRYVRVTADLAEARRDRAEIAPRSGRDRAEIAPRSRRDRTEIAPRSARDRAEIAQVRLEDRITDGALVAVIAYSAENWTV